MANPTKKPKSILKKLEPTPEEVANRLTSESHAREVAIQHAQIIQERRDLQNQINDSIIVLSKLPLDRSPSYSAANPSLTDVSMFRSQVRLFQPSDYDDLIEERNANGLCGYTLCPRPRIKVKQAGEWKLVNYGHDDFNIVPKKEIERWCSQHCARRAMYIKVQLNETAAWERAGISSIEIDLYEEPQTEKKDDPASRLVAGLSGMTLDARRKAAKDARDLAVERGDVGASQPKRPVNISVREKEITKAAEGPSLGTEQDSHLVLDGYKTKFDASSRQPNGTGE